MVFLPSVVFLLVFVLNTVVVDFDVPLLVLNVVEVVYAVVVLLDSPVVLDVLKVVVLLVADVSVVPLLVPLLVL